MMWRFGSGLLAIGGLLASLIFADISVSAADAQIRIIHAIPDAPTADVYLDEKPAARSLAFTQVTGYLSVPPGKHDFQVFRAGANPATDAPFLDVKGADIPPDAKLSVVAIGKGSDIRPLVVDETTAAPPRGKAKVRFVHAAPDAPAMDVAVVGGPVLFPGATFGNAYPYQEVDAATYNLAVRPAGTGEVALDLPGVQLKGGTTYTVFGLSTPGNAPKLAAVVAGDETLFFVGSSARVAGAGIAANAGGSGADTRAVPAPPPVPKPVSMPITGFARPQLPFDLALVLALIAGVISIGAGMVLRRRGHRGAMLPDDSPAVAPGAGPVFLRVIVQSALSALLIIVGRQRRAGTVRPVARRTPASLRLLPASFVALSVVVIAITRYMQINRMYCRLDTS